MARKKKSSINVPAYTEDAAVQAFKAQDFRVKRVELTLFTPALAAYILKFNLRNRGVVPKTFNSYKSDLIGGLWKNDTTDAIGIAYIRGDELTDAGVPDTTPGGMLDAAGRLIFDAAGEPIETTTGPRISLINGQHRCGASATTGCTFSGILLVGTNLDVRGVVDNNEARTSKHQLELDGIPDSARTNKIVYAWDALVERQSRRISGPAIKQMLHEIGPHTTWAMLSVPSDKAYGTPQIVAAFAYAHMAVQNDPALVTSLEQIAYYQRTGAGVGYGETHPIFYFRRHCHARVVDRNRTRANRRHPAFVQSLRALNAIMYALTGTPLKEPSKTGFPESEVGFKYFSSLLEPVTGSSTTSPTESPTTESPTASSMTAMIMGAGNAAAESV